MLNTNLTCQIYLHANDIPTFNPCFLFPETYQINNSTQHCQIESFACSDLNQFQDENIESSNLEWKCTSIFEENQRTLAMCSPFVRTHQNNLSLTPKMKPLENVLQARSLLSSSGCLDFDLCLVHENLKDENHQHCCCLTDDCNGPEINFSGPDHDFMLYGDYEETNNSNNNSTDDDWENMENNQNLRKVASHPILLSISCLIIGIILGRLFLILENRCCKKRQHKSTKDDLDQQTTILSSGANTPKLEPNYNCSAVVNIDNSNSRRILFDEDLESLDSRDQLIGESNDLITPIFDSNVVTPIINAEEEVLPIITPLSPSPEPESKQEQTILAKIIENNNNNNPPTLLNSRYTNSTYLTENSDFTRGLLNSNTASSQKESYLKSTDQNSQNHEQRRHVSPLLGFRNDLDFMDVLAEMNRFREMDNLTLGLQGQEVKVEETSELQIDSD